MAWIAALASIAGAGIGAASTGSAQRSANRANLQAAADTNASNELLFRLSRGAVDPETGQTSAFLPYYFDGIEPELAQFASSIYRQGLTRLGSPGEQFARAQSTADSLRPALDASRRAVLGEFNGQNLQTRLANFQPVAAARMQAAAAQSDAIREALSRQLGQIAAIRARGGFLGGSSFERNLSTRSAIDAYRQAAATGANATLANTMEERALRDADLQGRLRSDLPLTLANNLFALEDLPQAAVARNFETLMSPFNSFRMQPQAFQNQRAPLVSPSVNAGQILGSGLSSVGSTLLNYQLNNPDSPSLWNRIFGGGSNSMNLAGSTMQYANATPSYNIQQPLP